MTSGTSGRSQIKEDTRVSENHIRGIATTLALLDKALCEFDQYAHGYEVRSVLYEVYNTLSEAERELVAREVDETKGIIREIRTELNLEPSVRSADKMILSSCAVLWVSLVELESRHLRRYGAVPPGLAKYLDPRVAALNQRLRAIAGIAVHDRPR